MENNHEYDVRQLRLMHESLVAFEKKRIELNSLVGNLAFLLSVLESVNEGWAEEFSKATTVLEIINSLEIIKDAGEEINEIEGDKKEVLINNSVKKLKKIIDEQLVCYGERSFNES